MTRLDVTNGLIGKLIYQVAPLVQRETGWDLQLSTLNWEVLPQELGYENIVLGRLRGAGVPVNEGPRPLAERLVEYALEAAILAAYDPNTAMIMVVRENVDDSNLDGLTIILAHELVHRGQHINHPDLFVRLDDAIRSIYADLNQDAFDLQQGKKKIDSIQVVMTIIESHAAFVQHKVMREFYPNAKIENHFNLFNLFSQILGSSKTEQYTYGLPRIADAASRGMMDQLYMAL